MSAGASLLVAAPAVVAELRLGLLDDYLRSATIELNGVIDAVEDDLASPAPNLERKRERIRALTRTVVSRQLLYEKVGFPGDPLTEQTFEGAATCALAVEVATTQRERHVERLATREVPDSERPEITATVRLLTEFLRYARGETPTAEPPEPTVRRCL